MNLNCFVFYLATLLALGTSMSVRAADPYADNVVAYTEGTGVGNDFVTGDAFNDSSVALGQPTRFTSDILNFGGPVHPFNSPFRANEVVSIGEGGSLTVSFDEPVIDDPLNPFGIDLLVFGNSFYFLSPYASDGVASGAATEGGKVEVSADGVIFHEITGVGADGIFPTLGFLDVTDPLSSSPGLVPSDFTKPVDPNFDPNGLTLSQIVTGFDGSGGGVGIDLAATGLSAISYVRVSNLAGSGVTPEIDGFADVQAVPEPSTLVLAGLLGITMSLAALRRQTN
jgi:hypothetical protein